MKIYWLLILAFLFRLLLFRFGTFWLDMNCWLGWSERLIEVGFKNFYESWCDYLPSYLYILWFLGNLRGKIPDLLLYKLPSILADLLTAFLIYQLVKASQRKKLATLAAAVYLFNPAVWANSTLWGQADSFFGLFLVASFWFFHNRRFGWAGLILAFGSLLKPLGFLLLPVFIWQLLRNKKIKPSECQKMILVNRDIKALTFFLASFLFIFLVLFLPFRQGNLWDFIVGRFTTTLNGYPYTSVNAFNFWAIWHPFWFSDLQLGGWFNFQIWGSFLFFISFLYAILKLRQERANLLGESFWLAYLFFAAFLFLTRMHERHLFPVLPFLNLAAVFSPFLWLNYFLASIIYVLNLLYVHLLVNQNQVIFSELATKFLSVLQVVNFLSLMWLRRFKYNCFFQGFCLNSQEKQNGRKKMTKVKQPKLFLYLILIFALSTRLILLWYPKAYIFDEVYHAFTAQEMLKGNVAAWEWWNTPPAGFAYEWTHPPLAKLIMVAGLWLGHQLGIGSDFFWWRLPAAIFGTAVIFLTYLLGKKFFLSEKIGLLAAGFLSLEGLTLVMSRVGMADIYFLFFVLLTLVFAWERRWLVTALTWGLALATKWTGIYLVLPLLLLFARDFLAKRWLGLARFLGLLLIGGVVYLVVYLPFFFSGHSFKQFRELQWQMWAYHTNLKATHNYQSPALSWPLDLRPVWFYVNYQEKAIGNIYALGNPLFFWLGFVVLPLFIYEAWRSFSKKMIFLVLLYLVFWVPWIFSPRIMFLYHYLPSLPFLAMILSWMIVYFENIFKIKWLSLVCLGVVLLGFIWLYPLFTGILVPKNFLPLLFWLPSWK